MHLRMLDGAKKVDEEEEIESVRFWVIDTLDGKRGEWERECGVFVNNTIRQFAEKISLLFFIRFSFSLYSPLLIS